jgi:hypothetical protein
MRVKVRKRILLSLIPFIIVVVIMVPRLHSAQFGLLDDGANLADVRAILQGDLSMSLDLQAGRFRPLYWFYFLLIYVLAGANPFWFFFAHTIVFLILILEIRLLMKHMKADTWQIFFTSTIFIFTIPIIENFYTLSKGETSQLAFILAAVLCLEKLKETTNNRSRWKYGILSFITILSATLVKETAYIMVLVAILWAGYIYWKRDSFKKTERSAYTVFLGALFASIAVFFVLRAVWGAPPVTEGAYTANYLFSWEALLNRVARWTTLIGFYFNYVFTLSIIIYIVIIKKAICGPQHKLYLYQWGTWMLCWIIVLIPWEFAEVYYLLPFSLGLSLIIGLLIPCVYQVIKQCEKKVQRIMIALSGITIVLFLFTLTHYRTHALTQLTFDRINNELLIETSSIASEYTEVFTAMDAPNEYVRNIFFFLEEEFWPSRIIYDFVSMRTLESLHFSSEAILLVPYIENQPRLLLRAGVEEEFTMRWSDNVIQTMQEHKTPLRQMRGGFRIMNINLPVIICPILGERGFCTNPDPFLDTRQFSFGWDIFQIK